MSDLTAILTQIRKEIAAYKPDTARIDARQIIMHACHLTAEDLIVHRNKIISNDEMHNISNMVRRRIAGEPVTKIIGHREFWGLDFLTNSATLDPRPDSETLIEMICQTWQSRKNDPLRILDLGTGSGCLLLALLSEFENATGTGIEQSDAAAEIAKKNTEKLGMTACAEVLNRSWDDYQSDALFDIIVSNPPYIRTASVDDLGEEVRQYDPMSALDGGDDGLECYRQLYDVVLRNLKPDGMLVLEIGYDQKDSVSAIYTSEQFYVNDVWKDIGNQNRAVQIYRDKNALF